MNPSVEIQTKEGWLTARHLREEGVVGISFPGSSRIQWFSEEDAAAIAQALVEVTA